VVVVIVVTGATGNVGAEVVSALARAGEPVRALVREAGRAVPDGVEPVVGDLNEPGSLRAPLEGANAVFLLSGYTDMPGLLDEIRSAGVERVVLLSGGGAAASNLDNAISRYQLASEDAVRASGVDWTILRPYAFMSNALRWLPELREGDVVRAPFAEVANAVVDPYDIAAVAATALRSGAHAGQVYRVSGPQSLRPADQLQILADRLGRELRLEPLSNEAARAEMLATTPAEYVDAFFTFYVDGAIDESEVLPTVRDVTGVPPRTFAQWVETHAGAFA
jgi:uncharacterized protein YbjT (DUF2867 family)